MFPEMFLCARHCFKCFVYNTSLLNILIIILWGRQRWVNWDNRRCLCHSLCHSSGCHNKMPRTGWLKDKFIFSEGCKYEVRVPGGLGSGESSPSGLQMAAYSLYLHSNSCGISSYEGTNPSWSLHPHLKLITPSPNSLTLGVRALTCESGQGAQFSPW